MVGSTPPLILPATITWTIKDWAGRGVEYDMEANRIDHRQYDIRGQSGEEGPLEDNDWIEIGVYEIDGMSYQGYPVRVGICTNALNGAASDGALAIVDALARTVMAVPRGGVIENTMSPLTMEIIQSELAFEGLLRGRLVGGMGVFSPLNCDLNDINWYWPRQYVSAKSYVPPKHGNWENGGGPPHREKESKPPRPPA